MPKADNVLLSGMSNSYLLRDFDYPEDRKNNGNDSFIKIGKLYKIEFIPNKASHHYSFLEGENKNEINMVFYGLCISPPKRLSIRDKPWNVSITFATKDPVPPTVNLYEYRKQFDNALKARAVKFTLNRNFVSIKDQISYQYFIKITTSSGFELRSIPLLYQPVITCVDSWMIQRLLWAARKKNASNFSKLTDDLVKYIITFVL